MKKSIQAILAIFLLCPFFSFSQTVYSKIRFKAPASTELRNQWLADLEVDHFYADGEYLVTEADASLLKSAKERGLVYDVLVEDVARHFAENNRPDDFYAGEGSGINRMIFETTCNTVASIIKTPAGFTAGSMGGYYTYDEMIKKMDDLVTAYPSIVSKFSMGTSIQGRPIWGVKISDNPGTDEPGEPGVLYTGLQHAREAIGGASLIFFMQYLAENYAADNRVADLVNTREIYIVPCMNPDGYIYNQTTNPSGGGLWRKNRRANAGGSFGVDLNRNWSVDWANCTGATTACGSSSPSNDTYWGTAAFSEPETQAIRNFVLSKKIVLAIDQHCYGPYYSLPFGRPSLHTLTAADNNFYNYTAALMAKYNCQRFGNSPQTVGYEVAGGMKDWMLLGDIGNGNKSKVYGLTSEAGGGTFWAPAASIIPLSRGLCFQNLQAAYVAGSYFDLQDQTDLAMTTATGTFSSLIRRMGAIDLPVTVSIVPLENIGTVGSPVTVSSIPTYGQTSSVSIPYTLNNNITNGQRVRFAWKIETGGYAYYDTVTKYYNAVTLLFDNMEGTFSTNWTATNSPTTTNGWNYTTTAFFQGTRSLSESPTGNYTASSTRRVVYKNALNLADATSATLSFWVRHRTENCNDKLRIQVSGDGGTTYTSVCGINTIAESDGTLAGQPALTGIRENWTRELVDLSAFKGKSNVRLRFEFTSNADASGDTYYRKVDDGFYIDNLQIVKTAVPVTNQANRFLNLTGAIGPDQEALLNWEAVVGDNVAQFQVEKSENGGSFRKIGELSGFPPYAYSDPSLTTGTTQYRVKQLGLNGEVLSNAIVNLYKSKQLISLQVTPNPVQEQVQVQVNSPEQQRVSLRVTDALGRLIVQQQYNLQKGNQQVVIDSRNWSSQVYFLTIYNEKKEKIASQKLIRQ